MEFDVLRLRYRAVLDAHRAHTDNVLEHSKGGERPPESELQAEEEALWELAKARREFLDALNGIRPASR
jgi:hypothetical protein